MWGTRPASLARLLATAGGAERLVARRSAVVDPRRAGESYDAVTAAVGAGWPVPLFIGNGVMPRHVVLVVRADDEQLSFYDPSCGQERRCSRVAFLDAGFDVAGWPVPWLALLPYSDVQIDRVIEWAHDTPGRTIRGRRLRVSGT